MSYVPRWYKGSWCATSPADVRVPTCDAHVPDLVDHKPKGEPLGLPEELGPRGSFFSIPVFEPEKGVSVVDLTDVGFARVEILLHEAHWDDREVMGCL